MHSLSLPGLVLATHGRVVEPAAAACRHLAQREAHCQRASGWVPSQRARTIVMLIK